jgi:hypothetical protein
MIDGLDKDETPVPGRGEERRRWQWRLSTLEGEIAVGTEIYPARDICYRSAGKARLLRKPRSEMLVLLWVPARDKRCRTYRALGGTPPRSIDGMETCLERVSGERYHGKGRELHSIGGYLTIDLPSRGTEAQASEMLNTNLLLQKASS